MNILFLDDDLNRHHLFHSWLARAQKQRSGARVLNLFRSASKRQSAEPPRVEAAFTVDETLDSLRNSERFDIAFLDHDLDGRTFVEEPEGTGTEVAEFIVKMKPHERPQRIIVHSHNPAGAQRMTDILLERGCSVEQWPFGSDAFARCLREL